MGNDVGAADGDCEGVPVGEDEGALVGSEKLTVALVSFTIAPNVVFTVVFVG